MREFKELPPLKDDDLMPSGKHKDKKMINVPATYLIYIYDNDMCNERVKEYIKNNLEVLQKEAKQ